MKLNSEYVGFILIGDNKIRIEKFNSRINCHVVSNIFRYINSLELNERRSPRPGQRD